MFYKHLHDPSCDLFVHGEEAPQSKEAQLQAALDAEREKVKELEEQLRLANCDQVNTENDLNDVTSQLATIQAQLRRVVTAEIKRVKLDRHNYSVVTRGIRC